MLKDDDAPKMKAFLEWAKAEGREKEISPELLRRSSAPELSDAEIEAKIAEMEAARALATSSAPTPSAPN